LVMEYLAGGDLHKYLIDYSNVSLPNYLSTHFLF
jgi:hypothetical protein